MDSTRDLLVSEKEPIFLPKSITSVDSTQDQPASKTINLSTSCEDSTQDPPTPPNDLKTPPKTKNFKPNLTSTPNDKTEENKPTIPNPKFSLKAILINFQKYFNKKEEFSAFVNDNNPDVIIGTETWLLEEIKDTELMLDDYNIYRREREQTPKNKEKIGEES